MNPNSIELRKMRDFGEILNATFAFLRENLKNILKSCTPVALPIGLLGAIVTGFSFSKFFSGMQFPAAGTTYDPSMVPAMPDLSFIGMMYLGYFVLLFGLFFFYVSTYQYIVLYLTHPKDQINFQLVWSNAKGNILPLIGLSIVASVLLIVGFLLFIIPGIYMMIPIAFTFIIYIVEKKGVFSTIGRSFNVVSGEWFSSFGLAIVMLILQYAISLVVILPFYFILGAIMVHDISSGADAVGAAQGMMSNMGTIYAFLIPFGFLLMTVTSTMQIICITLKYFSIVEAKEGIGMMQKVDQMQPTAGNI